MPRCSLMFAVLLAFGMASGVHAEPAKKAPPSVTKIVDKAVTAVRNNRKPFDEANKKVLTEGEKELNAELDRLTKAGKLDDALVTREVIKSFKETVMDRADAPVPDPGGGRPAPQKPLLERMAGKWTHPNHNSVFLIEANGTFSEASKEGKVSHAGQLRLISDDWAEVTTSAGYKVQLGLIGDGMIATRWWEPSGRRISDWVIERVQ